MLSSSSFIEAAPPENRGGIKLEFDLLVPGVLRRLLMSALDLDL